MFRVCSTVSYRFLLHVYPEGTGPDKELIEMLERDMVDIVVRA